MPTPNKNESKDDFIKRCIPILIGECKDSDQAFAVCSSFYNEKNNNTNMKKDLPVKEVTIDELCGIDKISLVEKPAIEYDFVAMNKQEITLAKIENDKMILTGPALVPDKLILRIDQKTNEPYNQFFSKNTIQQIVEKYFLEKKNTNVNIEHSIDVKDIFVYESWIIKDSKNDKANALGFNLPEGTWMISMKCNNEEVWNELVKTNLTKGFSIEGLFQLKYSELSENDILFNKIVDILKNVDKNC